ncbi:hypothetical protein [Listeria goaensis]|nr:hypothetical protein [Listeria goaensis]
MKTEVKDMTTEELDAYFKKQDLMWDYIIAVLTLIVSILVLIKALN